MFTFAGAEVPFAGTACPVRENQGNRYTSALK
jgi:hypothetical protein